MADADFNVKAIISAQTSQFEKGMKNAQSSVNSLSSSISNITNLVKKAFAFTGVAIGTKAIVDFGKSCVQSANQAVKTFNILDNTVKATGADAWTSIENLESASKALSDSTNYSVTEIQKMQSVLLGFTSITGEAFDGASEAVLDMATVMGMDLTSAVQTVGKALDDPITGLDSLRRQGFKFTDEQKAELAQLVKNGKQLEAQKIILDTLAISYGGASKAGQDSFAKQRHAAENFSDALGGKLIPLMKSFATDNANMIDSLRESLNTIDFNQIGAIIKVSFDEIKKGIQNSFEYVKMIFSEIKSLMKNIDFKPIVSIINNLISVFEKIGKTNLSRVINVTKDLKDLFSGFSENIDLTKFSEVINLIINGFVFLHQEANKVFDTLLDNIKTFITNTWNSIKSIFEAGNKALANSETDIKSWGDYFYTIFNNLFKTVQDVIQSVSYLLSGDWEIAWQYAKLVVLRIVDSVINSLTTMITAFKDKIVGLLNFAQTLTPFLGTSGKVIKTALSGIEALVDGVDKNSKKIKDTMTELVENTENKIEELTGKPADKNIEDLEKFVSGSKNILGTFVDNFKEATDNAKKELDNLSGEYKATTNSMKNNIKSTYEKFSEWDSKLLQQRLEDLSEWSDEAHEINLALIEEERDKTLATETSEEEKLKINKYYNNLIEKENERFENAKREKVKETVKIIVNQLKTIASKTVEIFKKVLSTVKNIFSGVVNIFKNIFDFNPDDALDNLLAIEDAILTFFLETLPKLPAFFASAIQSIVTLIGTLINSIDWGQVQKILNSIIDTIVANMPTIVENLMNLVINIMQTLLNAIVHFVESGGWKTLLDALLTIQRKIEQFFVDNIDTIVQTISDMLPDLINTLISSIVSASKTLGKLAPKILPLIADLINAIIEVITSDEVLDSSMEAIEGIVDGLVQAIIKLLTKAIPKLINFAIKLLSPGTMIKVTVAVVKGLIEGFKKTDWNQVVKDIFTAFIDAVKSLFGIHSPSTLFESFGINMIEGLWNGLKEMGNWLNENVGGFFRNMWNTITSVFSNVGEWFKNAFSTVGSKITEGFGNVKEWAGNIWKNIQNAFSNVGNWFKNAFSNVGSKISEGFGNVGKWAGDIWNNIKNAFSGVGNWFKNTFESAGNGIKNAFNGLGKWFEDLWNNILNVMKAPINGIIDALNHVIDGFNSISVHIPDWVPFVGGKTFGINIAKIQKLAKGTNNARKGLTLVGEAGPELVKFNGGEQVLNSHNTQKALEGMGGTTINQNVTFNNLKDTTAFAMLQQLKQYNRQMAINGVL